MFALYFQMSNFRNLKLVDFYLNNNNNKCHLKKYNMWICFKKKSTTNKLQGLNLRFTESIEFKIEQALKYNDQNDILTYYLDYFQTKII